MKVALLDDYQDVGRSLGDWSDVPTATVTAFVDHIAEEDELVAALAGFDVVVAMRERTQLPGRVLERLDALRLLITTGMSNAAIDMGAAERLGITVCGTGGLLSPTSEHTWGLILALLRHIPADAHDMAQGGWQRRMGRGLAGNRLGLVGLGRLGAAVARVGLAFDMDVVAWSPNLTDERAAEVGVRRVGRDEIFFTADVVSVHLVLSERSRHLLGRHEIGLMRPTAVLVNTSRGPIVDEAALVDALATRRILGAALDVYDQEPLARQHPLRGLDNVVLTPHTGYVTAECMQLFHQEIVEDVAAFVAGSPIRVLGR